MLNLPTAPPERYTKTTATNGDQRNTRARYLDDLGARRASIDNQIVPLDSNGTGATAADTVQQAQRRHRCLTYQQSSIQINGTAPAARGGHLDDLDIGGPI
jgi:hypothetical protein